MGNFFDRLRDRLFGKKDLPEAIEPEEVELQKATAEEPAAEVQEPEPFLEAVSEPPRRAEKAEKPPRRTPQREPYFIQIGLDFGTAFCKCVCRDLLLDKAWVHISPSGEKSELPFLVASSVNFDGTTFRRTKNTHGAYEKGGLYHVKMALQKIGLKALNDPVLQPYRIAAAEATEKSLDRFVGTCCVYLVSGILGNIKREIASRYPGNVEGDYLAVNMAVPVADANHPEVDRLFNRILRISWVLADDLAGHPPVSYKQLLSQIVAKKDLADASEICEACYIYPEVSANVQGFIRSRTSSPGLYLFSDAGAGTVDQSAFLFGRRDGQDHLTYLHAGVFPLGSSHIERLAAQEVGEDSLESLEMWRLKKEAGEKAKPLLAAKEMVSVKLQRKTGQTIALSKQKLYRPLGINDLRVLFGGGGHCEKPYREAVINTFDDASFHPDLIKNRRRQGDSFDLGMPIPADLPLEGSQRRWINRLSVAYGLSFEKGQLATFVLPKDVEKPSPEDIWRPIKPRPEPPSKDDV